MALNLGASSLSLFNPKHNHKYNHLSFTLSSPSSSSFKVCSQSEGIGETREEDYSTNPKDVSYISSSRTQLDLLEQLTSTSSSTDGYSSEGDSYRTTIRNQLLQLVGDREGDDFSIPLGKNLKKFSKKFLTTAQKRNIKRQTYLNDVSKRNDAVFFSTIAAFVILPPIVILVVAVITGNVQLDVGF